MPVFKIKKNGKWIEVSGGGGGGGSVPVEIEDIVTIDLDGAVEGSPNAINADTLGGRAAEEFVLVSDLENIPIKSYDDTELRGLISANATEIENLKNMIGDANVSTQVDTAINTLRQEILGGEW